MPTEDSIRVNLDEGTAQGHGRGIGKLKKTSIAKIEDSPLVLSLRDTYGIRLQSA